MKLVDLGNTGIRINPLVYGTLPLGPLQAGLSPEEGGRLIRHALELGVNLVDTAELYGTYPHIKVALDGYSGTVHIASKTHANDAATARSHVERALRELSRERLEIVLLHGARVADPFMERGEVLGELVKMKKEGKIGHVGLSSHYISAIKKAAAHPEIEVIHPLINQIGMGILDGTAAEMAEAIAACARSGKGCYGMKALAGGNLIANARQSFRYVLGVTGMHAVAVGMLTTAEIEANLALINGEAENLENWDKLEKGRRKLKIMEQFCKGCGLCVDGCTNNAIAMEAGKARVNLVECLLCGYCAAVCPDFIIRVV